jgi:hypothetical protein
MQMFYQRETAASGVANGGSPGLGPGTPAAELPPWTRAHLERLPVDALATKLVESCLGGLFSEHARDAAFVEAFEAAVHENMRSFQRFIVGSLDVESFVPVKSVALASIVAQLKIGEAAVQESARMAARIVLDEWIMHMGRVVASGQVDIGDAVEAIRTFTSTMLAWQSRLLAPVAAALAAEQEAMRASRASVRRRLLRELLAGVCSGGEAELSGMLLYDMLLHHCAIVFPDQSERVTRQVTGPIRSAASVCGFITLPLGATGTAVWLGRAEAWTPRLLTDMQTMLSEKHLTAAIGRPARGVEGFLSSFRDAKRAESVRLLWGDGASAIVGFDRVALEALLLADPGAARGFVAHELGKFAAATESADELRNTVLTWFEAGSHVSAAASLGLHEHTVRNRLRRAEELLGRPLTTRPTELHVALRLRRVLGPPRASGGSTVQAEARSPASQP